MGPCSERRVRSVQAGRQVRSALVGRWAISAWGGPTRAGEWAGSAQPGVGSTRLGQKGGAGSDRKGAVFVPENSILLLFIFSSLQLKINIELTPLMVRKLSVIQ